MQVPGLQHIPTMERAPASSPATQGSRRCWLARVGHQSRLLCTAMGVQKTRQRCGQKLDKVKGRASGDPGCPNITEGPQGSLSLCLVNLKQSAIWALSFSPSGLSEGISLLLSTKSTRGNTGLTFPWHPEPRTREQQGLCSSSHCHLTGPT